MKGLLQSWQDLLMLTTGFEKSLAKLSMIGIGSWKIGTSMLSVAGE